VFWTKPDDFAYDATAPAKGLGGIWPSGFFAGFADGSVRLIKLPIAPSTLNALFTRDGGERVGTEALGQ
jgi:hypothetical protein